MGQQRATHHHGVDALFNVTRSLGKRGRVLGLPQPSLGATRSARLNPKSSVVFGLERVLIDL